MLKEPLKQVGKQSLSKYRVISYTLNEDKSFLVAFDGGYSAILNAEEVLKFDLYDTDEPGKITLAKLIFEINYGRARIIALSYASASKKTIASVREKLFSMGFTSDEIVEKVIDSLKSEDLVDDVRFAENFARKKAQEKNTSKRQLILLLMSKGVDRETSENAVYSLDINDLEAAVNISERMKKNGSDVDKIYRSLAGKGFDRNTVQKALEKVFPEE